MSEILTKIVALKSSDNLMCLNFFCEEINEDRAFACSKDITLLLWRNSSFEIAYVLTR
jgi:hypothetical protein